MHAVRHLIAQRRLAMLVCAATLLLKLLVPAGYMIDADRGRLSITLCPGTAPVAMPMDMPGMHGDMVRHGAGHGKSTEHDRPEMPCAFSGLSAAVLGPVDPVQLAALLAFVLAIGLAATIAPAPARPAFLRPPLRGPPAYL